MRRLLIIMLAVAITVGFGLTSAQANPSTGSGSTGNSVLYSYVSPLSTNLSITDLGGGTWNYNLSFTNTDTSDIWHFLVWTDQVATGGSGSFPSVHADHTIATSAHQYDARNIEASVTSFAHMWYDPFATTGLAVGGSGNISFNLSAYTTSFLYGYETLASGYAVTNTGQNLAAVGYASVPEPSTMLLLGSSLVGLGFVRRRFRK